MQLDRIRISIRERSYLDLLDLSVQMARHHPLGLLVASAAGAVPCALLNAWLISEADLTGSLYLLLVLIEMPIATAPLTLYLGRVMFLIRPSPLKMARDLLGSLFQLILYQIVLRSIFAVCTLTILVWVRFGFLNEIILLERASWTKTWSRTRALHDGEGSKLLGHALAAGFFGSAFIVCFWHALTTLSELMVHQLTFVEFEGTAIYFSWQAQVGLWIAICYFGLVRFLDYLNLRIRREGWEIELRMRALGTRLEEGRW